MLFHVLSNFEKNKSVILRDKKLFILKEEKVDKFEQGDFNLLTKANFPSLYQLAHILG